MTTGSRPRAPDHGLSGPGRHSLSLRLGGRVHRLQRLFQLVAGTDLSQSPLSDDGLCRPPRQRRGPVIENIDITQKPDGVVFGPGWKTYAERLQHSGVSWRVYRQGTDLASDDDSDGGMNTLMAFERFHTAKPGDPLYHAGVEPRRLEAL